MSDGHDSPYRQDARRTALLPLHYSWLYSSFLVPKARELGYTLCVHGSMARDCDIVAVPWTDDAVEPDLLAFALAEEAGGAITEPVEHKPHGRLSWSIHLGGGPYLDLSVTPREEHR